jgi:hypothetical protein
VIARPFAGPDIAIDAGGNQAAGKGWAQQQVIDAQPGIAGKGVPEIFPTPSSFAKATEDLRLRRTSASDRSSPVDASEKPDSPQLEI